MAGRQRSFEEREAQLKQLTADFEARQSKPRRRIWLWATLCALVLVVLGTATLGALYVQYMLQEPATDRLGAILEREGNWQREQRPTLTPLVDLAQWMFPAPDRGHFEREARPDYTMAGPKAALADSTLCYGENGLPIPTTQAARSALTQSCTINRPATRMVRTVRQLRDAFAAARPGDIIELAPGEYRMGINGVRTARGGLRRAPIIVRGAAPGRVTIRSKAAETFLVSHPFWVFENLHFGGDCGATGCEHALHIVGRARSTWVRNNSFEGWNAPIKANRLGAVGAQPDGLLVEANRFTNATPNRTDTSVTQIDVVGVDDAVIRANVVMDFGKSASDRTSYGIFTKGGSMRSIIERNHVRCENRHGGGTRIGISFGGGGTDLRLCSTQDCAEETIGGIMRANIVEQCSDVGIYLNRATATVVTNNTLVGTRGIDARFETTDARVLNNILDGRIIERDGASVFAADNIASGYRAALLMSQTRASLQDPERGDLAFSDSGDAERRGTALDGRNARFEDYCGTMIDGSSPPLGAIEQGAGANCAATP